jgi:ABC-type nitrate/sulfonate/bicarbonate transport system permease component
MGERVRTGGWVARRPVRAARAPSAILAPLLFALVVIALWQLYVSVSGIPESSLPEPTRIASALYDIRSLLLENGWSTVEEILLGLAIAVVLGTSCAALIASFRLVERAVYPWLVVSQTIPIVALAPIFVIWTGFDIRPKVMVIALMGFFPIAVNTVDGLRSTDPELLHMLRSLDAGRWQRFRIAQLPSALPFFFSGLKLSAVFAVTAAVVAELVGSSSGLGYLILTFNEQAATADMFATVVVLALIGIVLFFSVICIERLSLPWYWAIRHQAQHEDR